MSKKPKQRLPPKNHGDYVLYGISSLGGFKTCKRAILGDQDSLKRVTESYVCRTMNAIAMAFEVDILAAVQSSQSRMAIRESCTRICDVILVVNDILRIIQDAVLAVLLCKCLFHISILLCDGSSHISVGAHSELKLSILTTLDVPAAMDK